MPSETRPVRECQLEFAEQRLNETLAALKAAGVPTERLAKHAAVRGLRAKLRQAKRRIAAYDTHHRPSETATAADDR